MLKVYFKHTDNYENIDSFRESEEECFEGEGVIEEFYDRLPDDTYDIEPDDSHRLFRIMDFDGNYTGEAYLITKIVH